MVSEKKTYKCVICQKPTSLVDLLKVDKEMYHFSEVQLEEFYDDLPEFGLEIRRVPFIHMGHLGYEILNICIECFKKLRKKVEE